MSRSLVSQNSARRFVVALLLVVFTLTAVEGLAAQSTVVEAKAPTASGVVLGSFTQRANAQRRSDGLQQNLSAEGIRLGIVAGQGSNGQVYRVVAQSSRVNSRSLLQRLRRIGFADAWHISGSGLTVADEPGIQTYAPRRTQAAVLSDPSQAPRQPGAQAQLPESSRDLTTDLPRFAGPGVQRVFDIEAGVDLHELSIQTLDDAAAEVTIDGRIDEAVWRNIPYYDNMGVSIPDLGTDAEFGTKMRMFATEEGFYISADMEQPVDTLVQRLTRRDDWVDRDLFGVTIDASGEGKLGYWFYVSLGNSLSDGKVLPERRFQSDWDGPWIAKTVRTDRGWSAEMFLPWSMMDMPERDGLRNMGFVASRMVSHRNQRYQWPRYGVTTKRYVSAFNRLQMEDVKPVRQRSIIPFISVTQDQVYDDTDLRIGADFAWKPSPAAQISGSLSPDFGAVESDDVVLNLTASETFFPEKRLFFLEGSEIFNVMPRDDFSSINRIALNEDFSTTSRRVFLQEHVPLPVSLLNTRRIGGTASQLSVPDDVELERGQRDVPTDLLGAGKITGSTDNWRYGVLAAFEDDVAWRARDVNDEEILLTGQGRDFAVARSYTPVPKIRLGVTWARI